MNVDAARVLGVLTEKPMTTANIARLAGVPRPRAEAALRLLGGIDKATRNETGHWRIG